MILTITTTGPDARDLGYLLHKHPDRVHEADLSLGRATCFFPEAVEERCTAALVVEVDPVALVRGRRGSSGGEGLLDQYVNDRAHAASSLLSVALSSVFRTAMAGRCPQRPELVERPLVLEARIAALPCRGGEALLRRLFEPLGHAVEAVRLPLDPLHEEWGESSSHRVTLRAVMPLKEFLAHLYVLIPVLDDNKHYYVGDEEIDKLLRHAETWLQAHPERELIIRRYLRHDRRLTRETLARLVADEAPDPDAAADAGARAEEGLERGIGLDQDRRDFVVAVLQEHGVTSVVDLGCGEGKLLKALLAVKGIRKIAGLDVSLRALDRAEHRLGMRDMSDRQRERIHLLHGSLAYRDARLAGFDAAVAVEVIEHLEPFRLESFARVVLREAAPPLVVVTTPNVEYNATFATLPAGRLRHPDHRFEWTRSQFEDWARAAAAAHGYSVTFHGVGPTHDELGSPTQAGVFSRE